jgi:hypothetical protein
VSAPASPGELAGSDGLLRARASVLAFPAAGGWHRRRSWDLIRLHPADGPGGARGRITGSARLTASGHDDGPLIRSLRLIADGALAGLAARLDARTGPAVAQSVAITVSAGAGHRAPAVHLLVRAETAAGPVLAGGAGAHAVDATLDSLAPLPGRAGRAARPPDGWRDRALLLHPPVVAAVMAGARLALGSPGAARLTGRRILPDLTLADEPTGHLGLGRDDDGHATAPVILADHGRIGSIARDQRTGIPVGRACWQHDSGGLVQSTAYRLVLTGFPAEAPPADPLDLVACVEGVRRFHPDGRLRLLCIAGSGDAGRGRGTWFALPLAARPLALLRAVLGTVGPAADTGTDGEVRTPALLLPSVNELMNRPDGIWSVDVNPG